MVKAGVVVVAMVLGGCVDEPLGSGETPWTDGAKAKPKKCKEHKKAKRHADCTTVTATVGLQGGTVAVPNGGPVLTIPFGALPSDTTITISETDLAAPPGTGAVGPVYEFEPEGLVFARPVTVSLPVPAGVTTGQVWWSQLGGTTFAGIGGTLAGAVITAQTVHFSLAVVGSALGTRTVVGSSVDTWISASQAPHLQGTFATTLPPSSSCSELEVIVDDAAGGFARLCGTFAPDRMTFSVPGVPLGGDYILHVKNESEVHTLLVASSALPDLGRHLGGRPYPVSTSLDPALAARIPIVDFANIDLHIDGLGGWFQPAERSATDPGDQIEMFSTETDDYWFNAETVNPPASGATSADLMMEWQFAANSFTPALIEGDKDTLIVAKLEGNTTNGFPYQTMTRIGTAAPFTMVESDVVPATVTLAPLAPGAPIQVTFDGAAHHAALVADGNPTAVSQCPGCGGFVGVLAQGGDAQFGFYTSNADLLLLFDTSPAGALINTGAMPVGTVTGLPGSWGELASVRWSRRGALVLPDTTGAAGGAAFADSLDWTTTRAKLTGSIVPKLTQVRNARVNGIPFFAGAPTVGATTTVTWDAPSTGAPVFYTVNARRLFVRADNRTGGRLVASVLTPHRSFTFPPGILDPDETYAFTIAAATSTGDAAATATLAASPYKAGLDLASSRVTSGIFGSARGTPP